MDNNATSPLAKWRQDTGASVAKLLRLLEGRFVRAAEYRPDLDWLPQLIGGAESGDIDPRDGNLEDLWGILSDAGYGEVLPTQIRWWTRRFLQIPCTPEEQNT